jgi:NitT/TauT family transport system ATP-binding protein/nitrate/nitrite transport system ATP-binding protein
MIAALIEASHYCDSPEGRVELARMLAQPEYFDVKRTLLRNGLVGPFDTGPERRAIKDFVIFDARRSGAPTRVKGRWVFDMVQSITGLGVHPNLRTAIIPKIFREDIYRQACRLASIPANPESSQDQGPVPTPPPLQARPGAHRPERMSLALAPNCRSVPELESAF